MGACACAEAVAGEWASESGAAKKCLCQVALDAEALRGAARCRTAARYSSQDVRMPVGTSY
jgi:hypothetical protein